MPVYATPGVYLQPQPAQASDIRLVRTDIAGFVGVTERGPLPIPEATMDEAVAAAVRLTSWAEFLATFGGFVPYSYLTYAVRGFFENGGTTCYVVRVAALEARGSYPAPRAASYPLPGSQMRYAGVLAGPAEPGQNVLRISDDWVHGENRIRAGDVIGIEGDGLLELPLVVNRTDEILTVAQQLNGNYPIGTVLTKSVSVMVATAKSPGSWGNRIKLNVTPLTAGQTFTDFALRVTLLPGPDPSAPVEEEFYSHLSLLGGPFFAPDQVNGVSNLLLLNYPKERLKHPRIVSDGGPLISGRTASIATLLPGTTLQGGEDGLAGVRVKDFIGGPEDFRGLRILQEIDEVAMLCVPDAVYEPTQDLPTPPAPPADPCAAVSEPISSPPAGSAEEDRPWLDPVPIYRAMINQCELLRDRVAILDYPQNKRASTDLQNWKAQFATRFGAIYYPWLKVPDTLGLEGPTRSLPAAGHLAGVYASIDNQFGVARPPANAQLSFTTDVADDVTAVGQQSLNPFGINAIRSFQGRGIRVWGARSLAKLDDQDWRFIHVRRLMSMIEKSVAISTRWAVFEPNDFSLRSTIVHSLTVFLTAIWRTGGLQGATPAEGFYVKCDETNNLPAVVDVGQLICEVGVAIAAPMEFIVFEIHQDPAGSSVSE